MYRRVVSREDWIEAGSPPFDTPRFGPMYGTALDYAYTAHYLMDGTMPGYELTAVAISNPEPYTVRIEAWTSGLVGDLVAMKLLAEQWPRECFPVCTLVEFGDMASRALLALVDTAEQAG